MSVITITLPDGSQRQFPKPVSVLEVAASIGPRLAKDSFAGVVNGKIEDVRFVISSDAKLKIITSKDPESLEVVRHSAAHIMAQAIQEIWPEVKITIGPVIENGFFYDLDSPRSFVPEDLEKIEKKMAAIAESDLEIVKETWPVEKAIETFKSMGERFKVEIIQDLVKKDNVKEVGVYHQGKWFDLCRGPHVQRTSALKAFKLTSIAGAYWRGDEKNPMLQRIYGTAFASKKDLEEYLARVEESKKRDHRKIGKELDLFMFHQWAPASPFFLPKGTVIYNELQKFMRELYFKNGYSEVITPQIFDAELFKTSGHYDNYKENMYFAVPADLDPKEEKSQAMVKAMNCPGHALMFGSTLRSYRELPLKYADFGRLHRYERAGALHGLSRVRSLCQDDAHIFCTLEQLQDEISKLLGMLNEVYQVLGFEKYNIYFSTRPEKRVGADDVWDKAEAALELALKKNNLSFTINAGDGAFYGPKLDFMVMDAIGRPWQLATFQCDMNMANRFNLEYTGEDNKPHRPVVIHRAILGSMERFISVYIEHVAGHFPTWMSPTQAAVITITDSQNAFAQEVFDTLRAKGVRVDLDLRNQKLGFKIREAQMQKVPYMLIIGDQEVANKTVSVRRRTGEETKGVPLAQFVEKLSGEIAARSGKLTI